MSIVNVSNTRHLAALVLLLAACGKTSSGDDKSEATAKAEGARSEVKTDGKSDTKNSAVAKSGASEASPTKKEEPKPTEQPAGGSAGGEGTVPVSELEYVESKVKVDKDGTNFFMVWGEVKNKSAKWVEVIRADIRYFDASGKELGVDSVATGTKKDLGDDSAGEYVFSEIKFIAPGASVPMHHKRSLDKLGGTYGSHKIALRPAKIATKYPDMTLEGMQDAVANVANEAVAGSSPAEHRVTSGTLKNKGTLACHNPGLVVGFYDASGKLADLQDGDAKDSADLAPGATTTVKVFTPVSIAEDAWKGKATIKTWVRCEPPL